MQRRSLTLFALAALLAGCGGADDGSQSNAGEAPRYVKAHSLQQLMAVVIEPDAQVFWRSSGTVSDSSGVHDLTPTTPEGWTAAQSSAATVAEMGNVLMTPPYSQGRPEDIGVVETEFGRIAVLICADTFTDALFERLKAQKPDLLLVPYGWAATNDKWPEHSKELEAIVSRRAAELKCPMAGVDLVGEMTHGPWTGWTYGGSSFVADGTGRIVLTARDRNTDVRVIEVVVGNRE